VELGPEIVSVGRDDRKADDYITGESKGVEFHDFGWDDENPHRQVEVGRFRVGFRPIAIKDLYEFWVSGINDERVSKILPANWVEDGGEIKVCVVRLSRSTRGVTGRVGPPSLRPGTDEDRKELADDWIVR
jgi:hypothetical protein